MRNAWSKYRARDNCLKTMGFNSYQDYLQSVLWQTIRTHILERDKYTCRLCGQKATQVHHRSYAPYILRGQIRGKNRDKIIAICGPCHENNEFDNGAKIPLVAVNNKMKQQQLLAGRCVKCNTSFRERKRSREKSLCKRCQRQLFKR